MADFYDFNKPKKPASVFDNTPMGEYTNFATATAGLSPFSDDYTSLFKDVSGGKSPFADFLSKPMGLSSENAMQTEDAQNVAQAGKSESSRLSDLYGSLMGLLGGKEQPEDMGAKWKLSVAGTPYRTVDIRPRDEEGNLQKKETLSFGIDKNAPSNVGWQGPRSWEPKPMMSIGDQNSSWNKKRINPYTGTSISQIS